jgi:hypothetical protein
VLLAYVNSVWDVAGVVAIIVGAFVVFVGVAETCRWIDYADNGRKPPYSWYERAFPALLAGVLAIAIGIILLQLDVSGCV